MATIDDQIAESVHQNESDAVLADDKTVITEAEVEDAKQHIYKLHPLSRISLDEVMPTCAVFMTYCCCCFKKSHE